MVMSIQSSCLRVEARKTPLEECQKSKTSAPPMKWSPLVTAEAHLHFRGSHYHRLRRPLISMTLHSLGKLSHLNKYRFITTHRGVNCELATWAVNCRDLLLIKLLSFFSLLYSLSSSHSLSDTSTPPVRRNVRRKKDPKIMTKLGSWCMIPPFVYDQSPPPPSLIYGPHHLLRLFGKTIGKFLKFLHRLPIAIKFLGPGLV